MQQWKSTMTDSGVTVNSTLASGDVVVLEVTWQGTQNGAFTGPTGTIPPSGKRQTTRAAMIVQFQGNKIREIRHYFDMMTFLTQIGAMATAGARN
jgi:predicted ester cyclase